VSMVCMSFVFFWVLYGFFVFYCVFFAGFIV